MMCNSSTPRYVSMVRGLQCTSTCTRMKRSARAATVSSVSGTTGTGSSPRLMRSMTTAACFRASSAERSPWSPSVTRFGPADPLDCTTYGLAAGGMDAHAKACQVPVPEHGILLADGERIDSALGDTSLASSRHGGSPEAFLGVGRRWKSVIKPQTTDIKSRRIWSAEPTVMQGLLGTDQNAAIHLYTHERACPEARSARGRGVSNNARARQRPWISAVSARADSRAA